MANDVLPQAVVITKSREHKLVWVKGRTTEVKGFNPSVLVGEIKREGGIVVAGKDAFGVAYELISKSVLRQRLYRHKCVWVKDKTTVVEGFDSSVLVDKIKRKDGFELESWLDDMLSNCGPNERHKEIGADVSEELRRGFELGNVSDDSHDTLLLFSRFLDASQEKHVNTVTGFDSKRKRARHSY